MRPDGTNVLQDTGLQRICLTFLLCFCFFEVHAGTIREDNAAFSVTLQPFTLDPPVTKSTVLPVRPKQPRIMRAVAAVNLTRPTFESSTPASERIQDELGHAPQPFWAAYQNPPRQRDSASVPDPEEDYDLDNEPSSYESQETETNWIKRREEGPTVEGSRTVLRHGIAYAPSQAPQSVKEMIWSANRLRSKPYTWGGGHRSFNDHGYDCSGSVSFALHGAGLLDTPIVSDDLMDYGERGRGRWVTIYSRAGHTFAVIAGLRFDTTDLSRGRNFGPRWYAEPRDTRGYVARHPAGL